MELRAKEKAIRSRLRAVGRHVGRLTLVGALLLALPTWAATLLAGFIVLFSLAVGITSFLFAVVLLVRVFPNIQALVVRVLDGLARQEPRSAAAKDVSEPALDPTRE